LYEKIKLVNSTVLINHNSTIPIYYLHYVDKKKRVKYSLIDLNVNCSLMTNKGNKRLRFYIIDPNPLVLTWRFLTMFNQQRDIAKCIQEFDLESIRNQVFVERNQWKLFKR